MPLLAFIHRASAAALAIHENVVGFPDDTFCELSCTHDITMLKSCTGDVAFGKQTRRVRKWHILIAKGSADQY